ncbi:MAG: hypothetical protein KGL39_54985, partial [Patescibacteria group bacterium]|nr:hypothetical protein [Patescibacteria group bacterium]
HVIGQKDQRRLYDDCSGFVYSSVLNGQTRFLPCCKPERERAIQYLFVGNLPVQARLIPSNINGGAFVDFGETILRFLNDSTGYRVTTKPSHRKHWSNIVWDQIENVANAAFAKHGDRNSALRSILDRFNSFEDPTEFFHNVSSSENPEFAAGIPMLLVIVSDSKLESATQSCSKVTQKSSRPKNIPDAKAPSQAVVNLIKSIDKEKLVEEESGGKWLDLQSLSILDLLSGLENSTGGHLRQILLEVKRRTEFGFVSDQNQRQILTVLDRIQNHTPEIWSVIQRIKQLLSSKAVQTVKVLLRS